MANISILFNESQNMLAEQCTTITVDWLDNVESCRDFDLMQNTNKGLYQTRRTYGPVHPIKMRKEYPSFYDLLFCTECYYDMPTDLLMMYTMVLQDNLRIYQKNFRSL